MLPSSLGAGPLSSRESRSRSLAAPVAVSFVVSDISVRAIVSVSFAWGCRPVASCRVVVRPRQPPVQSVPPCVPPLVCVVLLCVRWWHAVDNVPCLRLLHVLGCGVAVQTVSLRRWSWDGWRCVSLLGDIVHVARWCSGEVVRWCGGAVMQWCGGAVVRWRCGAVAQWCSRAVVQWCGGVVVRWCRSAVVQWCDGVVV